MKSMFDGGIPDESLSPEKWNLSDPHSRSSDANNHIFYSHVFSEITLVLTWLLPLQVTDLFPADMVMLTVPRDCPVLLQANPLQTANTQSSQMEHLTVMLHASSEWLEVNIWMTGLGTASDIEG